jgi:hypothetical protein
MRCVEGTAAGIAASNVRHIKGSCEMPAPSKLGTRFHRVTYITIARPAAPDASGSAVALAQQDKAGDNIAQVLLHRPRSTTTITIEDQQHQCSYYHAQKLVLSMVSHNKPVRSLRWLWPLGLAGLLWGDEHVLEFFSDMEPLRHLELHLSQPIPGQRLELDLPLTLTSFILTGPSSFPSCCSSWSRAM